MINKKIIFVLIILAAFFNSEVIGQEVAKTGTTAAKFLSVGVGPRANAMGSAFSSVANDATAMYWNPAGIAKIDEYQTVFTYTSLYADINLSYFGLVLPAGNMGNFGVSVTVLDMGDMEVTTESFPEGTGEFFTAASYAFGLSYARSITEDFSVGMNVKYVVENIYNSSASGVAFDIGTVFNTPFYGIRFASSITNYGTKLQMEGDDLLVRYDQDPTRAGNNDQVDAYLGTDEFELPLRLQIGISRDFYIMENQRLTIAIDATHPNDNNQYVNVGGELALFDEMVFIRGGYKTLFLDESQEGLTFGAGFKYSGLNYFNIAVDYSYQEYEYLGNTHSFGILLGF